jgi:hypothetical protein
VLEEVLHVEADGVEFTVVINDHFEVLSFEALGYLYFGVILMNFDNILKGIFLAVHKIIFIEVDLFKP